MHSMPVMIFLQVIPLSDHHKINHEYPKLLSIPICNTAWDRVHVPKATVFSTLDPTDIESTKVSNISWTKTEKLQDDIRNSPTELPTMPPESSFQPEQNNFKRQSLILQVTQVPQETRDKLSFLLENEFDSIISRSSTDVRRTYVFEMDIPTTGPLIACNPYQIPLKYQESIDEEIQLLENTGVTNWINPGWLTVVTKWSLG